MAENQEVAVPMTARMGSPICKEVGQSSGSSTGNAETSDVSLQLAKDNWSMYERQRLYLKIRKVILYFKCYQERACRKEKGHYSLPPNLANKMHPDGPKKERQENENE